MTRITVLGYGLLTQKEKKYYNNVIKIIAKVLHDSNHNFELYMHMVPSAHQTVGRCEDDVVLD